MSQTKKRVVVIGGGNGSAVSLVALKQFSQEYELSAVISMLDSGYSSGSLRREFGVLPSGDILRAVLALSKYDYPLLKQIFNRNRLHSLTSLNEKLKVGRGASLGNLFLTFTALQEKDFVRAVRALEEAVESIGHAYPSTLEQGDLVVTLDNGDVIRGEGNIDEPTYNRTLKIVEAHVEPEVSVYQEAAAVMREADAIVMGPGDVYTSIISSLLSKGTQEAIVESKAKLIYIAGNAYHIEGETGPTTLSGSVEAVSSHVPRKLDYVIYNNHELSDTQKTYYQERKWGLLTFDQDNVHGPKVITGDFERFGGGLCPDKLGGILHTLIS
ncbi:MAG: 2-phospho-L-lactate transferase CofD family protein [Candidatus Magasanikbacteria bacterium]